VGTRGAIIFVPTLFHQGILMKGLCEDSPIWCMGRPAQS
jgi:hypothetical protein